MLKNIIIELPSIMWPIFTRMSAVPDLDTLGISARITLNSIYELEGYWIKVKSMTEPFDTSNPSGRFMITMLAGFADLERETILERLWQRKASSVYDL